MARHHDHTLLVDAEPQVALLVAHHVVDLAVARREVAACHRFVREGHGRRIEFLESLSVGGYVDGPVIVEVEILDEQLREELPRHRHESVAPAVIAVQAARVAPDVECAVGAAAYLVEIKIHRAAVVVVYLAHAVHAVDAVPSVHEPDVALGVLYAAAYATYVQIVREETSHPHAVGPYARYLGGECAYGPHTSVAQLQDVAESIFHLRIALTPGGVCECVGVGIVELHALLRAHVDVALAVLPDGVDKVVGQRGRVAYHIAVDGELRAVISVEAILGGYPYHTVVVLVNTVDEAARYVMVAGEEPVVLPARVHA